MSNWNKDERNTMIIMVLSCFIMVLSVLRIFIVIISDQKGNGVIIIRYVDINDDMTESNIHGHMIHSIL